MRLMSVLFFVVHGFLMLNSAIYWQNNIKTRSDTWRHLVSDRVIWGCTTDSWAKTRLFSNPKMVKSGKLRSGTGSKLKRWKKGHSSDSNPQTSRFRQAAKSRFFSRPTGKLPITRGSLASANVTASTSHLTNSVCCAIKCLSAIPVKVSP